jgi:hypothetical protein
MIGVLCQSYHTARTVQIIFSESFASTWHAVCNAFGRSNPRLSVSVWIAQRVVSARFALLAVSRVASRSRPRAAGFPFARGGLRCGRLSKNKWGLPCIYSTGRTVQIKTKRKFREKLAQQLPECLSRGRQFSPHSSLSCPTSTLRPDLKVNSICVRKLTLYTLPPQLSCHASLLSLSHANNCD